jgi:ATP-dependent protease ClpP protease subunit
MDEMMNYRQVRIDQMKEKECLENRNIWIDEHLDGDSEFLILRMFDRIVGMDISRGIKPCDAEPINVKISSYGGSEFVCFSTVDTITQLRKMGYRIYGYAYGKCMSSAFKIFISCTRRFAQPTCSLMCHQPNHGNYGDWSTMEDDRRKYEAIKRSWLKAKEIILTYTNITEKMLDDAIERNDDLYFWAKESMDMNLGIVDELI